MKALGAIGEGLVELGLDRDSERVTLGYGGDAANVCVMAARLGVPARLLGRVGDDGLGRRLVGFWEANGVDVSHVRTDPGARTGLYVNEPAPDGGHRFTHWRRGSAGSRVGPDELTREFFDRLGILVVTGVTLAISRSAAEAAREAIARARRRGVRPAFVLNVRPALDPDADELLAAASECELVIGSREDLAALFGDAESGRAELERRLGPEAELVVTDGERPAVLSSPSGRVSQPVPRVEVRNAAGAGDAFAGAYLAGRLGGRAPAEAVTWGVAAASLSVGGVGCARSYPDGAQVSRLAAELPAPTTPQPAGT